MSAAGGLQALIERQRAESFRPGANVSDERVLGVLIAKYLRWDGAAIAETAIAALEDANFSAEADLVRTALAA